MSEYDNQPTIVTRDAEGKVNYQPLPTDERDQSGIWPRIRLPKKGKLPFVNFGEENRDGAAAE